MHVKLLPWLLLRLWSYREAKMKHISRLESLAIVRPFPGTLPASVRSLDTLLHPRLVHCERNMTQFCIVAHDKLLFLDTLVRVLTASYHQLLRENR